MQKRSNKKQKETMEVLETPYEQEITIDFIQCEVCNKTIRGDSLYKIHLTTSGHIKKEDTLVFQGIAIRNCMVPDFADIEEYLRYLKLDEPIIGLNHLEEVSRSDPNDPQPGPRYACRLCDLDANLPNMVNHIIGRKHRQKYLEVKRPDLVSWNTAAPFSSSNSGKVIRNKAEVAERQDGKGTPKPTKKSLAKSVGRSNISRVPPQQKKNPNQNQRGVPSQSQEFTGFPGEYSHHSGRPLDDPNTMPPYRTKDRYMSADAERGAYPGEGQPHRLEFAEDDYKSIIREYQEDTSRRNFPESSGARHDPREETTYGPTYREEEAAPLYRKPSAGSDPLREFMEAERGRVPSAEAAESRKRAYPGHNPRGSTAYAGDDPHGRAYQPEASEQATPGLQGRTSIDYSHGRVPFDIDNHLRQRRSPGDPYSNPRPDPHQRSYPGGEGQDGAYPEEDPYRPLYPVASPRRRSLDREPTRPGNANGAGGRREPSGQDAKRQRLLAEPMDIGRWQEGPAGGGGDRGFGRRGPPPVVPNRLPEGARAMSDIPEPFRRFLQGAADDQMNDGKRRKKSRFSDATDEEMERAKGILTDEYASPDQEMYGGPPGPGPDLHRAQRPGPYAQQGQYNTESYPRENPGSFSEKPPESGNVFDLMNNIEIEDVEEADFLKSKLCNLLKEFQAKKLEKTSQKGQGPAGMSADYHHLGSDQQRAPGPGQHDRNFRDGPQGQQHERNFAEEPQDRRYENQRRQQPQEARRQQQQRDGDERGQSLQDDGSHGQPRPPPPPQGHPQDRGSSRSRYEVYIKQQRDRDERGQLQDDGSHGQRPPPLGHPEDRGSSRSRYEEMFGGAGQGQLLLPPAGGIPEEPGALYPERFNEPRNLPPHHHPHHRRPSGGNSREFFDHYPPANAFHHGGGEQGYGGQQRRPHHSSSLDKITSTLLELVARK